MTISRERSQALQFAGEFLRKIRDMHDAPELLRAEAKAILLHYPSAAQLNLIANPGTAADSTNNLLKGTSKNQFMNVAELNG